MAAAPRSRTRRAIAGAALVAAFLFTVEGGLRLLQYACRGTFAHLLPLAEVQPRPRPPGLYEPAKAGESRPGRKRMYYAHNGYFTYNPELRTVTMAGMSVPVNRLGFRGAELPEKGGRLRIWCLGGSSTFGYGVRDPYPEQLERVLNREGDRYQVFNGGVVASNAEHAYNMLRDETLVNRVDPDLLVVSALWNTVEQYENNLLVETIEAPLGRWAARRSIAAFTAYQGMLWMRYGEPSGALEAFGVFLDRICEWAARRRVPVILLAEPMRLTTRWPAEPEHPLNRARAINLMRRIAARHADNARVVVVPFFERTDWAGGEWKRYIIERGHLTVAGYGLVAEALAPVVRELTAEQRQGGGAS